MFGGLVVIFSIGRCASVLAPACLLGGILAGACAGHRVANSIEAGPAASDYAPLRVGASWTYAMMFLGQRGEMTIRMLGQKDGYFYDNKGGMFRHTPEGLRDQKRYLIRTPLQVGNKWKSVVSASAVEHYEIVSVGDRCESEAGSFSDCLVVSSFVRKDADMSLTVRWTWARGLGLLKVETEADIKGQGVRPQTKQSLIRYSLAESGAVDDATSPGDASQSGSGQSMRGQDALNEGATKGASKPADASAPPPWSR